MKIGILQTGEVPDELRAKHGDYPVMFERLLADPAFEFETFPVVDGRFPEGPDVCDGWVITGSKYGAYEDHAWIPPLEDFLRQAYAAGIPIVGICFGHQILAQALGGKVEKFEGGWSVGVKDYPIDGIGDVQVVAWHQDQVVELPAADGLLVADGPPVAVVGSTPFCRYAALAYGDRAWSIQPHPEFSGDFMVDLIEARGNILPREIAEKGAASRDRPTSSERVADHIKAFLKRDRSCLKRNRS